MKRWDCPVSYTRVYDTSAGGLGYSDLSLGMSTLLVVSQRASDVNRTKYVTSLSVRCNRDLWAYEYMRQKKQHGTKMS